LLDTLLPRSFATGKPCKKSIRKPQAESVVSYQKVWFFCGAMETRKSVSILEDKIYCQ